MKSGSYITIIIISKSLIPQKLIANYSIRGLVTDGFDLRREPIAFDIIQWRTHDLVSGGGGHKRGSEDYAPSRITNFWGFHIKNTHFCTLFIEKGHAVSAVTMNNAKICLQLMSKTEAWLKQVNKNNRTIKQTKVKDLQYKTQIYSH